jgi:hypothetical protein
MITTRLKTYLKCFEHECSEARESAYLEDGKGVRFQKGIMKHDTGWHRGGVVRRFLTSIWIIAKMLDIDAASGKARKGHGG